MANVSGITIGIAIAAIVIAIASIGYSATQTTTTQQLPTVSSVPIERTIYVNLVEPKGSTNIKKEPFPTEALPEGGGYELKSPDETGKWVVETYTFSPSVIVVNQGDTVNIKMLGINGALHKISIENYVDEFDIHRGELKEISFVADEAGTFKMSCDVHRPAMEGYLMVLPTA